MNILVILFDLTKRFTVLVISSIVTEITSLRVQAKICVLLVERCICFLPGHAEDTKICF